MNMIYLLRARRREIDKLINIRLATSESFAYDIYLEIQVGLKDWKQDLRLYKARLATLVRLVNITIENATES